MTAKEFYDTVVQLRDTQKMFFKTRHQDYLKKSKQIEKIIDTEIERVERIKSQQSNPRLF